MSIEYDQDGNPYYTDDASQNQNQGSNTSTSKLRSDIADLYKQFLKRDASEAEIDEAARSNSADAVKAGILASPEYKSYQPTTPPPTTPPPQGTGYNLEKLKSAWLGAAGRYEPNAAGLAKFVKDNSGPGGFAEGVTVGGSKKNKLYLGNESGGTFLADVIRGTSSSNPAHDWDTNIGGGSNPTPTASTPTAASTAETPAQRSARLAAFGLGPEGLQSQRPGAPPPRPGQMRDMISSGIRRGSGPYDPSGGRGFIPPKPEKSPTGPWGEWDPSGGLGTRGPDQGQGQSEGPIDDTRQVRSAPYDDTRQVRSAPYDDTRQVRSAPYDPSGGFEPGGFTGQQQGGGYQPVEDPGMYTPGAAYQAPEYRAPDPYQQATPFSRDEYQAATPFGRPEYQGATPFSRDEYQAATPFAAPTAADMAQDPGYQFRLSQGQKALERSGAARGVTNTGGNMKGLLDYGQQAASQEYGNVYGRNLNTYNTNEANRASAYNTNYGNALGAYNTNEGNRASTYNTNYNNAFGAHNANEANRAGAYQTNYGNALTAYNTNEANRAGAYNTNANNAYQQYTTNALAKNAYNQETESRRSGAFATNSNLYQQRQQDAYNRSQQAYNDAMAEYQTKINNQRQYERDRMSDLFRVAGI